MGFFDKIKMNLKVARWGEEFSKINHIFETNGDNEEALHLLNKILKIESDPGIRFTAFLLRSCALYPLGRYQETIDNANEALKTSPDCTPVLEQKGDALMGLGKFQEALKIYNEVLKKEPKNISTLKNKGVALGKLEKYQEAINTFDKILEIEPWNITTVGNKEYALNCLWKLENNIYTTDNNIIRIFKIKVPEQTGMWVVGEQGKDKTWNIYLVVPQEKSREIIKKNYSTKAFATFSEEILKTSFPYKEE